MKEKGLKKLAKNAEGKTGVKGLVIYLLLSFFCVTPSREKNLVGRSIRIREGREEERRQMATKSKSSPWVKAYFFIFLFSSFNTGLLSSLAKHKNDCYNIFFIDWPPFLSFLQSRYFFTEIYRHHRRKCRFRASEQEAIAIVCNASFIHLPKKSVMLLSDSFEPDLSHHYNFYYAYCNAYHRSLRFCYWGY